MWDHMGGFGTVGGGMGIGFILFWGLVIVAIFLGVRALSGVSGRPGGTPDKTPLDTLKERYARGEIQREEFEQKKQDLGG